MNRLDDLKHSVYVMWTRDVAVYVGMTSDWHSRLKEHGVWYGGDVTRWTPSLGWSEPITHIDVWELDCTRPEARDYERETIRALLPTHNRQGLGYRLPKVQVTT